MWHRIDLVNTDVSEERVASSFRNAVFHNTYDGATSQKTTLLNTYQCLPTAMVTKPRGGTITKNKVKRVRVWNLKGQTEHHEK
jgi:hypothetical protein